MDSLEIRLRYGNATISELIEALQKFKQEALVRVNSHCQLVITEDGVSFNVGHNVRRNQNGTIIPDWEREV
jgi:hypothetical protein